MVVDGTKLVVCEAGVKISLEVEEEVSNSNLASWNDRLNLH